ncbi:MAG TPA: (d)CMP kinase [Bacteroidia bacterium]|jgi:cytidylate kinase|nr:(d)CMP kinase [Bacteroidia bacterium]
MRKITIAIDGYSSCGKSTIAKAIAAKLGYNYVDSGAMYRCVSLYCLEHGIIKDGTFSEAEVVHALSEISLSFTFNPATNASDTYMNGKNVEKEIRSMNVSNVVSPISKVHDVRVTMVALQREMGKDKGVVMDGRDIGTNVFPDAELKIFMTADPEVRAKRRFDELAAKGVKTTMDDVRNNLASRDHEDSHRKENPLIKADDAIVLDNSDLTKEEQLDFVMKLVEEKIAVFS